MRYIEKALVASFIAPPPNKALQRTFHSGFFLGRRCIFVPRKPAAKRRLAWSLGVGLLTGMRIRIPANERD